MVWIQVEVAHLSVIGQLIQAMALLFLEHVLLLAGQVFAELMTLVDLFWPFFAIQLYLDQSWA